MKTDQTTYTGELVAVTCWCGIRVGIPRELRAEQLRCHDEGSHLAVWCPLGHEFIPGGESRADKLKRQLDAQEAQKRHLADQLEAAERSARAYKGHTTRLRKRAAAGVCPCCTRTFQNLQRHMANQHPDFAEKTDA